MLSPGIGTNRMRWRIIFPGEVNKCTRTIQPPIMSNVFFSLLSLSCSFHTLITYCSRDFSAADQLTPSLVNTKYILGDEQVAVKICLSLSLLALADQLFLVTPSSNYHLVWYPTRSS